ncbi:protein strawberry notch-like isoform X2 [Coccinella septempunctata]|uniref:protein strawberry notch-like isoform X2 n=1 Tax=Coccinella septempunctata TaxID=41139 RepID=UPI001D0742DD|nr:protein strawberry notch-like isoform X2 [Coccinella septempunctata]
MRPRGYSESTSPNRTVRYSAVNGRQMIPNHRLPPTTTTFGSLAHFRAHAQGQGIRTIRIVRPGRAQGASLTNGRITNGAQFRNSTVLDIQRTLESQGITDQSVARFVQKHMEQNHLKRKLVTHDHDYNSTKKQKKEIMEEVENEMELGVAETYSTYMPAKLGIGEKHPDPVVETASLSSVAPVDVWYELSIPHRIIENGTLSALQLESITYAAQAHEQILPDKTRAGYLIGDGAGVGKGRTIAGLILENFSKGRRRAVWVSISNDLKFDAERDLQDVGAGYIQVHRLNKMKYSHKISSESNGRNREGVLFCTYSSLIGESNAAEGKYTNRKSQIVQWCGKNFEGLLIFDECHKAKNLCPSGSMKSTKTGQMVLELQASLPNARVLYASATGASEPRNMAYMTRLGLWGKGTTFQTFEDFATAVEEKGVGGMEIVAMDMKLRGMYIARQLSFQDVKFTIVEVQMSKEFIKVYDESVDLWVDAMFKFLKAADLVDGNGNMRKTMNGQYWSTHQRFFKYLCIAAKVEEAIRLAHDAMKNNRCVVIGLQSTGEAGTLDQLEKGDGTLTDFVSTCKGVFQNLVEKHFPSSNQDNVNKILSNLSVAQKNIQEEKEMMKRKQRELLQMDSDLELSDDDSDHEPKEQERKMTKAEIEAQKESEVLENIFKKKHGAHVFEEKYEDRKLKKKETEKEKENKPKKPTIEDIEKANEMKRELLSRIEKLGEKLPKNTLDDLIDNLGGAEQVAEMTGRKGRVVQTENGIQYVSRSEQDVPLETLNVKEKERFMDGRKLVAIISEAASSGISLQSDKRALNKRKRYHITLELPWSADKAVQQFGRTHRSNQVSAPEYVFLITNLAGERRFASTVAKRLESLGALTHGDRRAADNRDLSQFNIDNKYGKNALETVMKSILSRESPFIGPPRDYKGDFFQDCTDALIGVGLIIRDPSRGTLTLDKDYSNISKFLNRILGIRVELQNRLFKYFTDTMNAMIAIAKRNGTFDLGILDLGANSRDVIKRVRTITFLYKHPTGVAPIELHKLVVERGLSWKDALQKFEEEASEQHEGFYASRHGNRGRHLVILLIKVERPTGRRGTYETDDKLALYRPNTGKQNQLVTLAEIEHKYYKTDAKEVQNLWEEQYNCTICSHLYMNGDCRSGSNCENGLRRRTYHVLAGAVLPIWLKIEKAIADKSNEEDNEKENKKENRKEKNKMQVIRVKTVDNMKIVGTLIKNHLVDGLVKVLTEEAESVKDEDFPEE